jgi:hypothetical protein
MPHDAINHIRQMGHHQKMPKTLSFADQFGLDLPDADDDVDDEHDSDFEPDDDDDESDDDSADSSTAPSLISMSLSDGDDDDDIVAQPLPELSAEVNESSDNSTVGKDDPDNNDDDSDDEENLIKDDNCPPDGNTDEVKLPTINIPDETPAATAPIVGEPAEIAGVVDGDKANKTAGVAG